MKYTVDKQESHTIFKLEEENLNSTYAPDLKSEFIILHNEGNSDVIFDMSGVKFVDSSGLSAILTAHRLWKGNGCFVIAGPLLPMVSKLIEISRLDTILVILPTKEEAIDYVKMDAVQREMEGEDN